MDSLHWRNLNGQVKFEYTKKQYFNRYLWRLVYTIPRVQLATDKNVADVIEYVRHNRKLESERRKYNSGYDHYSTYSSFHNRHDYNGVDEILVDRVRTVMKTFKETAKFRVEWNTMQVYAESEADLKRIAEAICHYDGIVSLSSPKPGTEDALRNGHVYMNKIDYKYKIILRDGNYATHIKESVLNQLSQRDDVRIPPNLRRELCKKYPALWGAYFYTNDDSIVTILSLISPGIVGKIHPVDQLQ